MDLIPSDMISLNRTIEVHNQTFKHDRKALWNAVKIKTSKTYKKLYLEVSSSKISSKIVQGLSITKINSSTQGLTSLIIDEVTKKNQSIQLQLVQTITHTIRHPNQTIV